MVASMTGFGRSEVTDGLKKITVELKSVNNRYLDLNIKMPRKFNAFDADIRSTLKLYMKRGKVDVFITYEDAAKSGVRIRYNAPVAKAYYDMMQELSESFAVPLDVTASTLSRFPEVVTVEEEAIDEEALWNLLKQALCEAGERFHAQRLKEGEFLKNDLVEKIDSMKEDVDYITKRSPEIIQSYQEKLHEKVRDLLEDKQIDEGRLLTEVTLFADKVAIDEELVRLNSHIEATKQTLVSSDDSDGIGRKLDFLAQEMNREANTILSKSGDVNIADAAIRLKTGIEKVREQIQNVE